MNRSKFFFIGITGWLFLTLASCSRHYSAADSTYTQYQVNKDSIADPVAENIIKPYRDSMSGKMNVVIGKTTKMLSKGQPESELGNFCADAFLDITRNKLHQPADACIINNGGLRLPSLPEGDLTIGRIYELLPFDNIIVVTTVRGDSLQVACDAIAKAGGWPVSAIKFKMQNNKAVDVTINSEALQRNKIYKIVTADYIANGGDNMFMLKNDSILNTGVLMREAMIDYIRSLNTPITANIEGRITQ